MLGGMAARDNTLTLTAGARNARGGMKSFRRYVFFQTLWAMGLILLSLCAVVWIALALRQLKLVTSSGQDMLTLVSMTTLAVPNLLALVAPIALLVASLHVLNRLNNDSELIVVSAAGGAIWNVARPLLAIAFWVALLVFVVNQLVMPWSARKLRDKIIEVRTDLLSQVLTPGRFSSPEQGVVVHIRNRRLDGSFEGILMRDERRPKELLTYLAERGKVVEKDGSSYLAMWDGHLLRARGAHLPPEILTFSEYAIDLQRFERKFSAHVRKPRERYYDELRWPDPSERNYQRNLGHFRAELHERFTNPLYPFLFVLMAVAFAGHSRSVRQNRVRDTAVGFLLAAVFRLGGFAANNLTVLTPAATPLLYIVPLSGILLALVLIMINRHPEGAARVIKWPASPARRGGRKLALREATRS